MEIREKSCDSLRWSGLSQLHVVEDQLKHKGNLLAHMKHPGVGQLQAWLDPGVDALPSWLSLSPSLSKGRLPWLSILWQDGCWSA